MADAGQTPQVIVSGSVCNTRTREPSQQDELIKNRALGISATTGSLVAIGTQATRSIANLLVLVAVSRVLSAEEFGVVAMALTVTLFIGILSDLGLSSATIQQRTFSDNNASALFYVNVLSGFILYLAAVATSFLSTAIYDKRVFAIVCVGATTLLLGSFAAQQRAILFRRLQWKALSVADLSSTFVTLCSTIGLAYLTGLGYWSLVLGTVAGSATATTTIWLFSTWRPGKVERWRDVLPSLSFGASLTGFNFLNYFNRRFDNILIGAFWGPAYLGYYDRAYSIFLLPLSMFTWPVGTAIVPVLSRYQSKPMEYERLFLIALLSVLFLTIPAAVFVIHSSQLITSTLYGPGWAVSGDILSNFSLCMLVQPLFSAVGWLFTSSGRAKQLLVGSLPLTASISAALYLGALRGPQSVALYYSVTNILITPLWVLWAVHRSPVSPWRLWNMVLPAYASGAAASAAFSMFDSYYHNGLWTHVVSLSVYLVISAGFLIWWPLYRHYNLLSMVTGIACSLYRKAAGRNSGSVR